jgi:hypothetical protein
MLNSGTLHHSEEERVCARVHEPEAKGWHQRHSHEVNDKFDANLLDAFFVQELSYHCVHDSGYSVE